MKQGMLAFAIGFTLILCSGRLARPDALPNGVTCAHIQREYDTWWWIGKRAMKRYLRSEGYTPEQINAAQRCIKEKS